MNDEEMVRTYSNMIYSVAMRYVRNRTAAEEVYSDVFYRYFRKPREFNDEAHRKAWLLRITVNAAKSYLMKQRYDADIDDDMFENRLADTSWEMKQDNVIAVREALKRLDEKYREPIELYYFSGLKVAEIARILGMPVGTVKSNLMRARHKLKELLS